MTDFVHSEQNTIDYTQIEINFQEQTTMRAQQTMSQTEAFVTFVGGKGRETKTTFWGINKLDQKTQRHTAYPQAETPREAYWFGTSHFWKKEPLDGDDQLYEATDPATGLSAVWVAAAAREKDRLHINSAIGTAYRGRYGQNTAQVLPASQMIANGGTGLTKAKIIAGVMKIRRAFPDQMDPIVTFVTSAQMSDLWSINEVINWDFNEQRPLKDLMLPFYFGTYFKVVDDTADFNPSDSTKTVEWDPIIPILVDGIGAGTHIRYCPMWVKSALRGKKDMEITTRIHDEAKDHGPGAKSITVDMVEGSTRVNPLGVVVIECADTSPVSQ